MRRRAYPVCRTTPALLVVAATVATGDGEAWMSSLWTPALACSPTCSHPTPQNADGSLRIQTLADCSSA
eukprot:9459441-Alexandrium_andersonii.AAC.1